ncbi:hypothetical protein NEIELOOT_01376 [Neisseria elongata subsp. glycolytica ATCC 29315]|uniref:Uncharacterized protein n=1 Tax=Neisseria elongata subsp. glycolytica ATCC 29315 TaxID=546263 RepID=D4DQN6_NEIEG|nr:hypothetical protein NEIELOOT_01376 [Neisseria elongata subsp. glycolytica ATCC 29315]
MPRLAVLFVLSAASSPCPDLNLTHYIYVVLEGKNSMSIFAVKLDKQGLRS